MAADQIDSAALMNGLVAQSVLIANRIDRAESAADPTNCLNLIAFAATLWAAVGYGYKTAEVTRRLRERANTRLKAEEDYLSKCRKNDRTRPGTLVEIIKLRLLVNG